MRPSQYQGKSYLFLLCAPIPKTGSYHVAQDGLKLITSFELLIFLSLSAECWELQVCPLACFIYLFRDQMVPCQYPTYWETRMSQPPPAHTRHHHPRRTKRRRVPHLQKPSVHRKLRHWPGRWLLVSQGHLGCAGGQHATSPQLTARWVGSRRLCLAMFLSRCTDWHINITLRAHCGYGLSTLSRAALR